MKRDASSVWLVCWSSRGTHGIYAKALPLKEQRRRARAAQADLRELFEPL